MKYLVITLIALRFGFNAEAAVLTTAPFNDDEESWSGAGSMTVDHSDGEGNPAGSLQGSFEGLGTFVPQTGAFRIDTDTGFLGAYPGAQNITGFTLDFLADSVLPLDVNLRLLSGVDAYYYTLNISGLANSWSPFTVFLADPLWQGNAGVLANVTAVEVQVARGSAAAQLFFLDNFSTIATPYEPPLGGAVPEPSTGLLVIYFGALIYGMRKRVYSAFELESEWEGPRS